MRIGVLEEGEKRKCFREAAEAGVRREGSFHWVVFKEWKFHKPGGIVPEKRG